MVNNDFFDAETSSFFHSNLSVFVKNPRWWGGEPIWVTAVRQGRKSAASFWAGSEAEISGVRPTYWRDYDYSVPFDSRLEQLVGWLKLPSDKRPAVITFYLEEANTAGHLYGPDSPELLAAIKLLDGRIGAIIARLKQESMEANIVIVSDHGMNSVSGQQVMLLEDYLDPDAVQVDFQGSVAGLRPIKGTVDSLVASLKTLPHATVYRVEDLPARLHIRPGARIPPVWVVPELGWSVVNKAGLEKTRQRSPDKSYLRGDHGYDPVNPTMHGIFIAYGPSFLRGKVIPEFENVHIYNLLCAATELKPAPNDGDDRLVKAVLR
jgi:predicted AlkP superfamily pyrophosphatase or phosphodiesterase